MPANYLVFYCVLLCTASAGIFRFRQLAFPDKLIAILVLLTLIIELSAYILMIGHRSNQMLYHAYSPVELLLVSLYFHQSVAFLRRTRIALIIGILAVPIAIVNAAFLQNPLTTTNTYFLLFEGIVIIMYCYASFHQILMEEELMPFRFAQFWISGGLLFYWTTTYAGWGIYTLIDQQHNSIINAFIFFLSIANYVLYAGIAVAFIRYPKLISSGA